MQDRTTQYAADVLAGKIIAGDLVKLACKRHLDDIEKSKAAPYKYYFDVEQAERIIEFAETLTIAEGEEEEQVECYAFQCFILGNLNGWRTKTGGHRRFRTSYVQLGRQNGKSFLNGILAAYYGNFEKYKYGQIYCTATKKDQSLIVFNEIVKFIRSDPDLDECFNVHEHNSTIDCLLTHSKIKALSGDTKSIDGFRPYLGIVDEYHAHKNDQMYKLLEGGIKKMKSALISVITTAGLWIRDGLVTVTETMGGVKTDYRYILTYLEKIITDYELDVQFILYDPHNASAFLTDLEALGFDSVAVTQSAKALNDATVDFRLEIESGNVEHDGNAMIKWSIANAKTTSNSFGEIKIDKEYQTERIDVIDAIIDAWTAAMKGEVKQNTAESVEEWLKLYEASKKKQARG